MVENKNKYISIFTKFVDNTRELVKKIKLREQELDVTSTHLEKLIEQYELGYIKSFLPPLDRNNRSLKHWQEYLETHDTSILSEEDIYNLAFNFSTLSDKEYWFLLEDPNYIKEIILFAIIRNFHYFWRDLENFDYICNQITIYLKKIKSDKKIIKKWQKNPELILGDKNVRLESRLLSLLKHNIARISDIYKNKLYDIEKTDLLANLIKYEYILNIYKKTNIIDDFENNLSLFKDFYEYSLRPTYRKDYNRNFNTLNDKRDFLLSVIIETLNQYKNVEEYKQNLIDYILESPIYGDPRNKKWVDYEYDKAIEIFKQWLNENDLEFFFEALIENDPHDRKGFWKHLSNSIDNSMFVLGNNVESNNKYKKELSILKKSPSKNIVSIGSDENLISANIAILTIGNYTFIEFFSNKANACYVYEYEYYKNEIRPLLSTNNSRMKIKKDLSEFKQKGHITKFNHDDRGHWKQKILEFIDNN